VPLLEVDGHKISQSGAIVRYLANRFHLNGKDEFEAARADSIYGYFYDQIRAVVSYNQILLGMREGDKVLLLKSII
jgi:glutathione S-transferase